MENILERLKRGDIIVGDGALGTLLMQRGLEEGNPPETINLTEPQYLEEISSIYLEAGAEIITTNTFGATSLRLQLFSLEAETERINRTAVSAARKAVGDRAYVSGSVGPTAKLLKPYGDTDPEEAYASYRQQIGALISGGIDIVCIETMTDLTETELAVKAARDLNPDIPVMATVTFRKTPRGFFTIMGNSIRETAERLKNAGANIIGSNCGNGAEIMVEIAWKLMQYAELPVAIQSNAGLPVHSDDGLFYPETPEFVAEKAAAMLEFGVQIVGGCCGTGPEHIRAIRKAVDSYLQSKPQI
ncbi:MAG: homocysteine S-methyltransferase family protein [Acidobacteria bacterium]|nr:homocysteine S-methyltransferase family protein [Acidobacteriota bacterium]